MLATSHPCGGQQGILAFLCGEHVRARHISSVWGTTKASRIFVWRAHSCLSHLIRVRGKRGSSHFRVAGTLVLVITHPCGGHRQRSSHVQGDEHSCARRKPSAWGARVLLACIFKVAGTLVLVASHLCGGHLCSSHVKECGTLVLLACMYKVTGTLMLVTTHLGGGHLCSSHACSRWRAHSCSSRLIGVMRGTPVPRISKVAGTLVLAASNLVPLLPVTVNEGGDSAPHCLT